MSGGGSDDGPPIPPPSCAQLAFQTVLVNVNQPVLQSLSIGEQLPVTLQPSGKVIVVTVLTNAGAFVGAIASHVTELLHCIDQGYSFVAEIQGIDDGVVTVRVQSA